MFDILWNDNRLWNKHIVLILAGSYVLESDNTALIQSFITSAKTKTLFNTISLAEKQKYIQFMLYSLQAQKEDDSRI